MVVTSFGAAIVLGLIDSETSGFRDVPTAENLPFIFIFAFLAFAIQAWLVGVTILLVKGGRQLTHPPTRLRSSR